MSEYRKLRLLGGCALTVRATEYDQSGIGHCRDVGPQQGDLSDYRDDLLRDFRGVSGELVSVDAGGEIVEREILTFDGDGDPVWRKG